MNRKYILAIDQGTTSSRAIVFGDDMSVVSKVQKEFPQHYPRSGWVEHDPKELWETVLETCRAAVDKAQIGASEVAAIGVTNQRETVIIWDRTTGVPVYPAIVWQDRRTAGDCQSLRAQGAEELVRERTGLLLDPYFSATKIAWILDHVGGARQRAEAGELAFGTVDTYLLWHLTGGKVHATEATNASRTSLFDIIAGHWDQELCDLFRVPTAILPEVGDCSGSFGETSPDLFGVSIPILGMAGDQQAAAIGQACFDRGSIKATFGTGGFVLLTTGARPVRSSQSLLTTIASRLKGRTTYALEGSVFIAGAAVQWLRDGLGVIESAEASGELAALADPFQSVVLVPAFAGLGAPYWEPSARGAIFGLNRNSGTRELARATLESVCFQTRDLIAAMSADYQFDVGNKGVRVDGGLSASNWAMQFQADTLACHIDRPVITETTALGAAWLAGHEAGIYSDQAEYASRWRLDRQFQPNIDEAVRERRYAYWRAAVEATLLYARRLSEQ
jgi:glycerol kinase